jgi:hypothetical protein
MFHHVRKFLEVFPLLRTNTLPVKRRQSEISMSQAQRTAKTIAIEVILTSWIRQVPVTTKTITLELPSDFPSIHVPISHQFLFVTRLVKSTLEDRK